MAENNSDDDRVTDKKIEQLESKTEKSLDDLNDYCLLEILSYLNILDLKRVEKYSNRWEQLCHRIVSVKIKGLKLDQNFWRLLGKNNQQVCRGNNMDQLEGILQSYGDCFEYYRLEISYISYDEENKILFILPELCQDIVRTSIDILEPLMINSMIVNWKNLEKLEISILRATEEDLCELLKKNNRLKYFSLSRVVGVTGVFLECLPENSIETIKLFDLSRTHQLPPRLFTFMSNNYPHLHSLTYSHCKDVIFDETLKAIGSITSLTNLSLSYSPHYEYPNSIDHIANLVNLKQLNLLGHNNLRDENLIIILKNCKKLESLNICGCNKITDAGLIDLAELTGLRILQLPASRVTNETIDRLPVTLEVLTCKNNRRIKEKSVIDLIRRARNLRYLDLENCTRITSAIATAAAELIDQRQHTILEINIAGIVRNIFQPRGTESFLILHT